MFPVIYNYAWSFYVLFLIPSYMLELDMKLLFPTLVMLLLTLWPASPVWSYNDNLTGQDADQTTFIGHTIISSLTSIPKSSQVDSSPIFNSKDSDDGNHWEDFSWQQYITPNDPVIIVLADKIRKPKDAYQIATQWTYITDEKLNHVVDKWLTPHEFLTNTPHYLNNPLQGEIVSDCEEKANTLVSLMRAKGIQPEEVRVVLGEVTFNDIITGHAWVELLIDDHWLDLDPCWGPYWDGKTGDPVCRKGVPFDYYATHTYPVGQVWTYYNDIYYLDVRDDSGDAPVSWH
jgi:hypothetical protein